MFYRYGGYLSAANEAGIAIQRRGFTNEATGLLMGCEETWTIRGFLQASDPIALTALITGLEAAFSVNYMPAQWLANDGTTIVRQLLPITPLGGTRVISPPFYEDDGRADAEFSTYRRYTAVIMGRYLFPQAAGLPSPMLVWHETITQRGTGGPRFIFRQPLVGFPQKQTVADATPIHLVQRGSAVGLTGYPFVPDPIWPEAEHEDQREMEFGTPQRSGTAYLEFPASWSYTFEDISAPSQYQPNLFSGV